MGQPDDSEIDVELDVREIDGPPFGAITSALADLDEDERLLLINSFEPEPLYDVLEQRGCRYETEQVSAEEWHVVVEAA